MNKGEKLLIVLDLVAIKNTLYHSEDEGIALAKGRIMIDDLIDLVNKRL